MEGNQMKIREALEFVAHMDDYPYTTYDVLVAVQKARDALAEPPRNCDRFADELDAQLAFLNEVWLISVDRETMLERDKFENWTDEMRSRYAKWLLAPAAEQKGEVK